MSRATHYKVKKGGEMPKAGRSYGAFCPFKEMDVGDHFTFNTADEKKVQALADAYGRKNGCAFFINIAEEATCWRTV